MHIPSGLNSGTCWELANELEQFINTTPPQRTWVGLTDEEITQIIETGLGIRDSIETALDKLKEKNA